MKQRRQPRCPAARRRCDGARARAVRELGLQSGGGEARTPRHPAAHPGGLSLDLRHVPPDRLDAPARRQADGAGRHARSWRRRRTAVRVRVRADLPRPRPDQREPRLALHLHRAVLRRHRRALVSARRPLRALAVARPRSVLCRDGGRVRRARSGCRHAHAGRGPHAPSRRRRLGRHHAGGQGNEPGAGALREDAALSAHHIRAGAGAGRGGLRRAGGRGTLRAGRGLAALSDAVDRGGHLSRLVRVDPALFGEPAFGLHLPHAAVRRRRRAPGAGRPDHACFRAGGGAGGGRSRAGEPATLTQAAQSGTSLEQSRSPIMAEARPEERHRSVPVDVGGVRVGGGAPIVVQSMTNTDTADVEGTARQVAALARAGSEIVRVTVDRDEAAAAVPHIKERLLAMGVDVPIVGDFHYIGHKLLADHPACAEALDKYRINPGNVGFKEKKDRQFGAIVETAIKHGKPVRIGANWGSLDQALLTHLMDENARSPNPIDARAVTREAMVQSALLSAQRAEEIGLARDRIILSAKVSAVQDLIAVYQDLADRSDYALHLGLTEAGMGSKGIVASSAALGVLLQQGIGDTIRISLTPEPGGDRTLEVKVAQEILQTMGFRVFVPLVAACPGCGRTTSTTFQELARDIQGFIHESMPEWKRRYPGVETLNVAVMGCIVNGPGESKHADIGISLPGTGEQPAAPVFIDGKKVVTLRGPTVAAEFKQMVIDYIERRFGQGGAGRTAAE